MQFREKGSDMRIQGTGVSVRQRVTRMLGAGVLVFMYAFGMIATTGAFMAAGVSPALAQRGRGRGRGGGWDRGRGGGWDRGRGRGDGVGAAIGLGVGAAIIGGAIAAGEAQRRNDAIGYCMQRYRSYDPQSMTYLGHDGFRHPCP